MTAAWTHLLIQPNASFEQAFRQFDETGMDTLIVAATSREPRGLLTERGARRALLSGARAEDNIACAIEPLREEIGESGRPVMRAAGNDEIELVVNGNAEIEAINNIGSPAAVPADTLAVLMVGGLGTRLYPLTTNCPKPLLPVHGKPLLEITVERLAAAGIKQICLTVGYRAEMIRQHFGDGSKWNVSISYIDEKERLGTCGALRLLTRRPRSPLIVMNGDVITHINFAKLLSFHQNAHRKATMGVFRYEVRIPYGVIEAADDRLANCIEKPLSSQWINAGIYVLDPQLIDHIPANGAFDMPSLLEIVKARGDDISLYAMNELWIDIGSIEEYERANLTPGILPPQVKSPDAQETCIVAPEHVSRIPGQVTAL